MRPRFLSRPVYVALLVPFGLLGALRACAEAGLRRLGWMEPDDTSWIPSRDPLLDAPSWTPNRDRLLGD